jgi:hypothetical protein
MSWKGGLKQQKRSTQYQPHAAYARLGCIHCTNASWVIQDPFSNVCWARVKVNDKGFKNIQFDVNVGINVDSVLVGVADAGLNTIKFAKNLLPLF